MAPWTASYTFKLLNLIISSVAQRKRMAVRYDLGVLCPQKPPRTLFHPPLLASKTHPIQYVRCRPTKVRAGGPSNSDSERRKCGEKTSSNKKKECKERELVEALESLEEEAITGEDEGREATDYNRRAHIFDACSKVFQDLKDPHHNSGDDGQTN